MRKKKTAKYTKRYEGKQPPLFQEKKTPKKRKEKKRKTKRIERVQHLPIDASAVQNLSHVLQHLVDIVLAVRIALEGEIDECCL